MTIDLTLFGMVLAFGGGLVSFLSPCVLPIVPAYLSLITGLTVGDLKEGDTKVLPKIALDTGLFVADFTVVFVLLGLITTAVGDAVFQNQETLTRISGALVILMALYLAGSQILMAPSLYHLYLPLTISRSPSPSMSPQATLKVSSLSSDTKAGEVSNIPPLLRYTMFG